MSCIAIIDTGYPSYDYEKELFKAEGFDLKIFKGDQADTEGKYRFAMDAAGIMLRSSPMKRAFFEQATNLRAVRYGVGYDNVDIKAASEKEIKVAIVQGYANHSVSDHAMALMFACQRGLLPARENIFTSFAKPPFPDVFELHDKTLGIIGLGRIGSVFARKASTLFARVLATDPYISNDRFSEAGIIPADLATTLSESHVVSIHCSLTEETYHMINDKAFGMMQNKPILINTARGAVIEQNSLLRALNKERIHSAGIDVWENEPVNNDHKDLIRHPRLVSTGHVAWYSEESLANLQKRAAHNMIDLLRGKLIPDCLNP